MNTHNLLCIDDLDELILYWRNLSSTDIFGLTEELKMHFNIGCSNGLDQIASDLTMLLEDS